MKYEKRRRALEYEKALVDFWKKDKTFEKSVENRNADKSYVFYDGPPFITGNPHHGTLLSSIVKDAVPRFWTMQGYRCERRWGWDCHGLPAENFVEKQMDITDRRDIGTKVSLEDYITKACSSMVANSETWRDTIDRVGRWVDFDNAYRTMDKDFMESVWWAFKQLYEAGKIYEGRKVLMYDTKFATPVSKAEVTMDNDAYQNVTDPSAFVKFKISKEASANHTFWETLEAVRPSLRSQKVDSPEVPEFYLLAWTTTPWTLPANLVLAVKEDLEYGVYGMEGEKFILVTKLAEKVLGEGVEPETTMLGKDLVGLAYEPLIRNFEDSEKLSKTYTVMAGDFVGDEEGTGIVHCAPAYGEDDYTLTETCEVDFVDVLDENGYYLPEVAEKLHALGVRDTDENGIEVWAGNKFIAKVMEEVGMIWKIEYIRHEYPFNPRSKQRIMYRAFPSWFFDVECAKPMMLEQNENVNWFPTHLKHGRFAKNIEQAPDWNLSRDRFWATAMPVWKGDKGTVKVVGSYNELYELSGVRLKDYHRPWVDEVEFDIDGEHFKRIEKVLDCWFESGSMPFAQMHYPFENKEKFEANYPADFIVEYVGQVRAWFYYVHVVNTNLASIGAFGKKAELNAYKNVITTGTLAGNDGRKMSKSLGNYTDPNELMDKYSADSLRFLLLSSPVLSGEDFALIDKDVSDTARKLTMIWNVYDFFSTYANVDDFEDKNTELLTVEKLNNELDQWIVSRVYELRNEIVAEMEKYDLPSALAGVLPFVDDLSNWFVRRSRRRFWKSGDSEDKAEAYQTLAFVLRYLALIFAPFVPFLAEELWQKLGQEGSVHLQDYPEAGAVSEKVLEDMTRTREIISEALSMRMEKNDGFGQVKVRQPLSKLVYAGESLGEFYEGIIAEEVNVKEVSNGDEMNLDKTLTDELRAEGAARELIRFVQNLRKHSGLEVDDRIHLSVHGLELSDELVELVKAETLAVDYKTEGNYEFDEIVKIGETEATISLAKSS